MGPAWPPLITAADAPHVTRPNACNALCHAVHLHVLNCFTTAAPCRLSRQTSSPTSAELQHDMNRTDCMMLAALRERRPTNHVSLLTRLSKLSVLCAVPCCDPLPGPNTAATCRPSR
jgi:hypothetical protein